LLEDQHEDPTQFAWRTSFASSRLPLHNDPQERSGSTFDSITLAALHPTVACSRSAIRTSRSRSFHRSNFERREPATMFATMRPENRCGTSSRVVCSPSHILTSSGLRLRACLKAVLPADAGHTGTEPEYTHLLLRVNPIFALTRREAWRTASRRRRVLPVKRPRTSHRR